MVTILAAQYLGGGTIRPTVTVAFHGTPSECVPCAGFECTILAEFAVLLRGSSAPS
jgi:hypothetical protein